MSRKSARPGRIHVGAEASSQENLTYGLLNGLQGLESEGRKRQTDRVLQ
jgi:hypothetical protein